MRTVSVLQVGACFVCGSFTSTPLIKLDEEEDRKEPVKSNNTGKKKRNKRPPLVSSLVSKVLRYALFCLIVTQLYIGKKRFVRSLLKIARQKSAR